MQRGLHVWLKVLALVVLGAFAHGPLLGGAFRAPDRALLERAAQAEVPQFKEIAAVDPRGGPLAGLAQTAFARAKGWRPVGRPAFELRLSALVLLLGTAVLLGRFARRLLVPWVGVEHATAAAWAASALALCHPATTALIADPAALSELFALALGTACAALFLRGRQDRSFPAVAGAFGLALLAGFAGGFALALPFLLAFAELVSSHRYRPRRERARTAANTLLFFGAAVAIGQFLWLDRGGVSPFAIGLARVVRAPLAAVGALVERTNGIALPANPALFGAAGWLVVGAMFVLALQPAIGAARSAPRLWSRMLVWWLVLVAAAATYGLDVRVRPETPSHSRLVTLAVFAFVLGPAAASTALSGLRRAALPWCVAAVWAWVSASGAWAWRAAAEASRNLGRDLEAARELFGNDVRMLVLDAPTEVAGVETLGSDVGALVPGDAPEQSDVIALSARAFQALAFEPEMAALRADLLVVVAPIELFSSGADAARWALRPGSSRQAVRLGPPSTTGGARTWRGIGSWEPDLDTLACELLQVRTDLKSDVSGERRVRWRVTEPAVEVGSLPCVWIETGAEPVLVAHLGASLPWLLGDRVRRVWFEGGGMQGAEARLREAPEAFSTLRPTDDGDDWLFERPTTQLVMSSLQRGRYVLSLLSLKDYSYREIEADPFGPDLLKAPGAPAAVAAMPRPVAWRLEFRVEGVPLARATGRRVGRDGTVEQ
jgi:hypothetical protein